MKQKIHKRAKAFLKSIIEEYDLSQDELKILDGAVDQLNLYWTASDLLSAEGMTIKTGDMVRQHPAAAILKQSWAGFLSGCRLLQIGSPADMKARPGRPDGGHQGANS